MKRTGDLRKPSNLEIGALGRFDIVATYRLSAHVPLTYAPGNLSLYTFGTRRLADRPEPGALQGTPPLARLKGRLCHLFTPPRSLGISRYKPPPATPAPRHRDSLAVTSPSQ